MKSEKEKQAGLIAKFNASPGPKRLCKLNNFDVTLREHGVGLITAFGVFEYLSKENLIRESADADLIRQELIRKYQIIPLWISFATGIECLAKAVLIKYDALDVLVKNTTSHINDLKKGASNYKQSIDLYNFINISFIDYSNDQLSPFELRCVKKSISHLHNLNIGTLWNVTQSLDRLCQKGITTEDETWCLFNSLKVLTDFRRNVDVHTFHNLIVGKSINGDLDNLYLPSINLLLDIYSRQPA